jgi:hypothetical protein
MKTLTIIKGKNTNKEIRTVTNIPLYKSNFGFMAVPENEISVFCDVCPSQAEGTVQDLERQGWQISKVCEFCPDCNLDLV